MPDSDPGALRALLLTAGLGTRLRPLTCLRAKAAVPINGVPLVVRAIRSLERAGIRDLVLNLHHRPASIAGIIGDGCDLGVRVRYSWEQPVLGSAGGPRHALPLLVDGEEDDFLIVNGDTLTDLDVAALIARHRESDALVTMALIRNPRPDHYGGVLVSEEGWVEGFTRRTAQSAGQPARENYHFIGVQVARARAFASLQDGVPYESVSALYPQLIASNPRAVAAHISTASFLDIGTPRDCLETSLALAASEGSRLLGDRVQIDSSAEVTRSVLWDDVAVGAGAVLLECVVGDGATIPAASRFERAAIVPAGGREPGAGEDLHAGLIVRRLDR
jgi:mannose-1-phosphate guanylyltransferase